jgi:hypothetical protein
VVAFQLIGAANRSPSDVVTAYMEAVKDQDASEAISLMCASQRAKAEKNNADDDDLKTLSSSLVRYSIVDEKIDGNSATVNVSITARVSGREKTETVPMKLVKEDGDWKLCMG